MIYLDLDGVVADCDGAFRRVAPGLEYESHKTEIWQIVSKIPDFFLNLEPLPNARLLYDILSSIDYVEILTASPEPTGHLVTVARDKVEWVHRHISPLVQVNVVPRWSHKKYFCKDHDVLVDDSARNIEDWVSVGGRGVVHTSLAETVDQVVKMYAR